MFCPIWGNISQKWLNILFLFTKKCNSIFNKTLQRIHFFKLKTISSEPNNYILNFLIRSVVWWVFVVVVGGVFFLH